jgi:hypothetical protein
MISTGITTGSYFPDEPYIQGSVGWANASQTGAKEFCFTITIPDGTTIDISNVSYNAYATGEGPSAVGFRIGGTNYAATNIDGGGTSITPVSASMSDQDGLTGSVEICMQGWDNGYRITSGGGDFRLDDVVVSGAILPVELSYFKAKKEKENINILWQTQSEQNNSHFEIQRSNNSKTWTTIDKVIGAGTTDEVQDYTYTDKSPIAGMNYYRLMQVDYDGAFEYSPIVSVDMGKDEAISVYPNPAADQVVFEFETEQKEGTVLYIYNMNGQLLRTNILAEDASKVEMNVSDLVEGIYFMQIMTDNTQLMSRFVKQ